MEKKLEIIETPDYFFITDKSAIEIGGYGIHNNEEYRNKYWKHDKFILVKCTESNKVSIQEHWDNIIAYQPKGNAEELNLPLLPEWEEDIWQIGNIISVTTTHDLEIRGEFPNHNEYINKGKQTYVGELIERDKGLCLKTNCGKHFNTQATYWFGSILRQEAKLIEKAATKVYSEEDLRKALSILRDYDGYKLSNDAIIQSLKQPKTSKWFVAEMETPYTDGFTEDRVRRFYGKPEVKTTTINGKVYLVGKYE
jgi:hypothetical protein